MEGSFHEGLGEPEPIKIVITPPSPQTVSCAGDFQDVKEGTEDACVCPDGDKSQESGVAVAHEGIQEYVNGYGTKSDDANREVDVGNNSETTQTKPEPTELETNTGGQEETGTEHKNLSPSKDMDPKKRISTDISHIDNKTETAVSENNCHNISNDDNGADKNEKTEIAKVDAEVARNEEPTDSVHTKPNSPEKTDTVSPTESSQDKSESIDGMSDCKSGENTNPALANSLGNNVAAKSHIENTEVTAVRVTVGLTQVTSDVEIKNSGISIDVNVDVGTLRTEKSKGNIEGDVLETDANAIHEANNGDKNPDVTEDVGPVERPQDEPKEQRAKKNRRETADKCPDLLKVVATTPSDTHAEKSDDTLSGDISANVEHDQPTSAVATDQRSSKNEDIPQASTSTQEETDITAVNVSSGSSLERKGSVEGENTKPYGVKAQSSGNRHVVFANVDNNRMMEGAGSDFPKPSPESKLYFEHDAIASRFNEQSCKHRNLKGFISQTNNEHTVATNYRNDLILFCTVFAFYGTNFKKMLPRIRRQSSLAALFETRINQYEVYTGTITKRIGKNVLTVERIANLAPQIVCQIVKDGKGKEIDLSCLGVCVPSAMQTTMFAGICPSGPPTYCYYFYYQLSRKFFNRPVSINEIKKRVVTTFHSLLTTKERQDACVKLDLAEVDGEWAWKRNVLDVFKAAEKEWVKIKQTDLSLRRVSLDFHHLLKSIDF